MSSVETSWRTAFTFLFSWSPSYAAHLHAASSWSSSFVVWRRKRLSKAIRPSRSSSSWLTYLPCWRRYPSAWRTIISARRIWTPGKFFTPLSRSASHSRSCSREHSFWLCLQVTFSSLTSTDICSHSWHSSCSACKSLYLSRISFWTRETRLRLPEVPFLLRYWVGT